MGLPDHLVGAAYDYGFVKATSVSDSDGARRYVWRRVAAVAFVPGLLIAMMLGQMSGSAVVALAALTVLVVATGLAIILPGRRRDAAR